MGVQSQPTVFGRYQVLARVAEGSLGTVFRARHAELERDAAIKVLRPDVRGTPAAVAALRAEASTLASLDHPHIVALYDFVEEPERTWLAEQWVDGAPLDAILEEHGRLTPEQALGVLTGALKGLAYAHDHGIVHRDVAASNVLADLAGTSMLVDFGLAAPVAGNGGSGTEGVVGTPAYLSPEAARNEHVGKPGDVYSAAALAYHLLSGLPVFRGTAWEMVAAHRERPAPALAGHGPRIEALLARSLAKDPAARPPDAAAFLAELDEAAAERYGADWRRRASIAGLVGATAGAGGALVTGGGAAAPTVVAEGLPQVVTGATRTVVTTGRRIGLKTVVAAGATAAVVVAGVVAGITLTGDDDASDSPGDARSEAEQSEEDRLEQERQERVEELEAAVPTGRYRYRFTHVDTRRDGGKNKPVKESGGPWIFSAPDCDQAGCSGSIDTKGPGNSAALAFTWDGSTLEIDRSPAVDRGPKQACVDSVTGEVYPIGESAARWTVHYAYQPAQVTPGPDGGMPERFTVTRTSRVTWEFFGTCEKGPREVVSQRTTWVFTRVS